MSTLSPTDLAVIAGIIGSTVLFGGAVALALGWAFRSGQFENFQQGARSIFGPDEPIGEPTDYFPGTRPKPPADPAAPYGGRFAEGGRLPADDI